MTPLWTFDLATSLCVGPGSRRQASDLAAKRGTAVLLVSIGGDIAAEIQVACANRGLKTVVATVDREPDCALVDELATMARREQIPTVIAAGGGSAIDAAKAAAVLATNPGLCQDYLEGLPGPGPKTITQAPLPIIAIPTTAGTGAEVTRNAVIQVPSHRVKRSLRGERVAPVTALIDPDLVTRCPKPVAAAAAFDALSHLVEAHLSTAASPMTDALALPGITAAIDYLQRLSTGSSGPTATAAMALAATWGGICLANARLGAGHGLVAPLGGRFPLAHGVGMACLLPPVLTVTQKALQERDPDSPTLARLTALARLIVGADDATVAWAADRLTDLRHRLGLPGLGALAGFDTTAMSEVAAKPSSSIATHPITLNPEELLEILRRAR